MMFSAVPTVYELILDRILPGSMNFETGKTNYSAWYLFWFHLFMKKPLEYSITECNWDWVSFSLKFSALMKKCFEFIGKVPSSYEQPVTLNEIISNIPLANDAQTSEQIQLLFDELFTKVLNSGSNEGKNDNIVVTSFSDSFKEDYYRTIYMFKVNYYVLMNCFKHKKDFKLDKLFEELDKLTDVSPIFNEKDVFISKFIK
ncbi:hypothetical protein M9Y10_036123 [Tritrichomonas musculus]|uniref:Uncharacterized protein n=1 Tax=Tritrichomonas musculus TaxID=1915356 RepID=A0ABR2GUH5_9EUKA